MEQEEISKILGKYKQGYASQDEVSKLYEWYRTIAYTDAEYPDVEEAVKARMFERLNQSLKPVVKPKFWSWPAAAAAIFIILGIGLLLINNYLSSKERYRNMMNAKSITAGKNNAILTLDNGEQIALSSDKTGIVTTTAGLSYNDGTKIDSALQTESAASLTITTPRGGQYQVVLPDGTHVWLNAASSVKFPSRFNSNDRVVELRGEAYFEVKKLDAQLTDQKLRRVPFKVISNGQEVEVLGTHFNVSSYPDEQEIRTTLIEGAVRLNWGTTSEMSSSVVLKPGQQAVLKASQIAVSDVDAEYAIAWKNGKFSFKNEPLQYIMRKVARWYNVEVVYQNDQSMNRKFSGKVSRYDNVYEVLNVLEMTGGATFKIEGRTITVK